MAAAPPPPPPTNGTDDVTPPPPPPPETEGGSTATSQQQQQQPSKGSPNDFLKNVIGKQVAVRLNSGIDYRGTLSCLDGYMNIALEETTEWVAGQQKNTYGDAFIRGNNVLYITALSD